MEKTRRTEIAELGEFGLIDLLTSGVEPTNDSTLRAVGDVEDDRPVGRGGAARAVLGQREQVAEGRLHLPGPGGAPPPVRPPR